MSEPQLMGTREIADRIGVCRQRVQQMAERHDFPEPMATLAQGRIWRADDVERWIAAHRAERS